MVLSAVLAAVVAAVISCLGTWALIPVLRRRAVLDRPNERSSHIVPTPRGGGLALMAGVIAAWLVLAAIDEIPAVWLVAVAAAAVLMAVSWLDDLRGLPPLPRFAAQIIAVVLGLWALPPDPVFQGGLPAPLDHAGAAIVWLWFINLFNFMDGIDGIAGSEAAAIGIGLALIAGGRPDLALAASAVASAAIGFLVWNWAPARIFMGDVGSVPLGYLLGFLLLSAATRGEWEPALILPLYFFADATITLGRRLARGEKIWQAHREHFYQRAVQRGLSHAAVTSRVIAADLLLILCAWAAGRGAGIGALAAAAAVVAVLLASLAGRGRRSYTRPQHRSPE